MDSVGLKNLLVGLVLGIGLGTAAIRWLGFGTYVAQHGLLKLAFGYGCWTAGMLLWTIVSLVRNRWRPTRTGSAKGRE